MVKDRKLCTVMLIAIILGSLFFTSCAITDRAVNPREWGYDCMVIYDALGGTINSREVRESYYMENSYVFKPSGTTNMLIEPVKDGYILVGWYTDKEDILDAQGNIIEYSFRAEDRWDFDEDRVQEDMTLYARWIPQAKVQYVDPATDEVKFTKNIVDDTSVQPLSSAAEKLIAKKGFTFEGYYEDKNLTIPYNFTEYEHKALVPSNEEVYEMLYEEFPQYIEKVEYVEPQQEIQKEDDEEEEDIEEDVSAEDISGEDTSDLYINKLGYEIKIDDANIRAKIRKRKDEIYEEAINYYLENTEGKDIYLKYTKS